MTRPLALLSICALFACNPGEDDTDPIDETGDVTDTGEDDTGDTDPGDDTGETETEPCEGLEVTGAITVEPGALLPEGEVTIDLVWVEPSELAEGAVRAETTLAALVEGSNPYSLCMEEVPPAEDLVSPDEESPDLQIAPYVVRVHASDGAGGTQWIGASFPTLLTYVDASDPELGITVGWNTLTFDLAGGDPSPDPFTSGDVLDVEASLLWRPQAPLEGVILPDLTTADSLHVGAYNITPLVDDTFPPPAQPMLGAEPVTVTGASAEFRLSESLPQPPADHLTVVDDMPFMKLGMYIAMAFDDTNGNGSFDMGEPGLADSLSVGESATFLVYFEPTDWRAAAYMSMTGLQPGWSISGGEGYLPWSSGTVLQSGG